MNKKSGGAVEASLMDDDWPEIQHVVLRPERRTLSLLSLILMFAATGSRYGRQGPVLPRA